jgi:hypothetical protein
MAHRKLAGSKTVDWSGRPDLNHCVFMHRSLCDSRNEKTAPHEKTPDLKTVLARGHP